MHAVSLGCLLAPIPKQRTMQTGQQVKEDVVLAVLLRADSASSGASKLPNTGSAATEKPCYKSLRVQKGRCS